jgi:hypothetical protein
VENMARRKLTETIRGSSSLEQQHTSADYFSLCNASITRPKVKPPSVQNCPIHIRNTGLENVFDWNQKTRVAEDISSQGWWVH